MFRRIVSIVATAMACIPITTTQAQQMAATGQPAESVEVQTLGRLVTVSVQNASLREAIDAIAANAKVQIQYRDATLATVTKPVSVSFTSMPLGVVLGKVLDNTRLHAIVTAKNLVTIKPMLSPVQVVQGTIAGKVIDAKTKQPVTRATVFLGDAQKGQTVGDEGTFRIAAEPGEHRITVRAVGYVRNVVTVAVTEGETTSIEIVLDPSASVLDEVVVTGTVVATQRRAIATPITVITSEEIERRGITSIEQFFRGEVPGVIALDRGSEIYGGATGNSLYSSSYEFGQMVSSAIYSRGASDAGGSNLSNPDAGKPTPLKTFVDGVEIVDPALIGTIDPAMIERIEIIAGPQASTIYGSGAMGGVMQIFTKKGTEGSWDAALRLRFGGLQNNLSTSIAPTHNHSFSVNGGSGASFSYSANLSHNYRGQWRPGLYSSMNGASFGVLHDHAKIRLSASAATTWGNNGTVISGSTFRYSIQMRSLAEQGEIAPFNAATLDTRQTANSFGQTLALNAETRVGSSGQIRMSLGRGATKFSIVPQAPRFSTSEDSLYRVAESNGARTTLGINASWIVNPVRVLSATITGGMNVSKLSQTSLSGCTSSKVSNAVNRCVETRYLSSRIQRTVGDRSVGGFMQLQTGLFNQLFLTFGLRAERNPSYGEKHVIDWTPTNQAAYTFAVRDLTMKLFGSYGKATRAPNPEQRMEGLLNNPSFNPSQWVNVVANPLLRPEYSSGPEGGIEMYYGNIATLTINHYSQKITDLISYVFVDSVAGVVVSTGDTIYHKQRQYLNHASVRQRGWEATGSVAISPMTIRGTYSWNDSRVLSINPNQVFSGVEPGNVFYGLPSHSANVTLGYARGPLNITLVNNWIGSIILSRGEDMVWNMNSNARLLMYTFKRNFSGSAAAFVKPGYIKSDLAVSYNVGRNMALTLNMINLGNSYGSEGAAFSPTLGRQTSLGVTLRRSGAR